MSSRKLTISFAMGVILGLAQVGAAQTSTNTLTYQGILTQSGAPVSDGTYTLTFNIYNAASGGTLVETVTVPGVATTAGRFTAMVSVTPSTFSGADRWWSVSFNGVEMSRQKVTATPYAVRALSVGDQNGVAILPAEPVPSRLGINTTPQAVLHAAATNETQHTFRVSSAFEHGGAASPPAGVRFDFTDNFVSPAVSREIRFNEPFVGANGNRGYRFIRAFGPGNDTVFEVQERGHVGAKSLSLGGYDGQGPEDLLLQCNGRAQVRVLTILGADLAENFDISSVRAGSEVPLVEPVPGMVVSIDPLNPGKLIVSTCGYDKRVAGVISGARGLDAGVILGKENADPLIDGAYPVAMAGRVWVWADLSAGSIEPGDRLTSSGTRPGYAMKVTDEAKAAGSVIGKAMTPVDPETGMILVLVNLQ